MRIVSNGTLWGSTREEKAWGSCKRASGLIRWINVYQMWVPLWSWLQALLIYPLPCPWSTWMYWWRAQKRYRSCADNICATWPSDPMYPLGWGCLHQASLSRKDCLFIGKSLRLWGWAFHDWAGLLGCRLNKGINSVSKWNRNPWSWTYFLIRSSGSELLPKK